MPVDPSKLLTARQRWAQATGAPPPQVAPPLGPDPSIPGSDVPYHIDANFDRSAGSVAEGPSSDATATDATAAPASHAPGSVGGWIEQHGMQAVGGSPTGKVAVRAAEGIGSMADTVIGSYRAAGEAVGSAGALALAPIVGQPVAWYGQQKYLLDNLYRPVAQTVGGAAKDLVVSAYDAVTGNSPEAKAQAEASTEKARREARNTAGQRQDIDMSSGSGTGRPARQVQGPGYAGDVRAQEALPSQLLMQGTAEEVRANEEAAAAEARLAELDAATAKAKEGAYREAERAVIDAQQRGQASVEEAKAAAADAMMKLQADQERLLQMGAIDPYKMFKGVPGVFNLLAATIGSIAGGIAGGLRGDGINRYMDVLNAQIQQSVSAQAFERDTVKAHASGLKDVFDYWTKETGSREAAIPATRAAIYAGLANKIQQLGEMNGSEKGQALAQKIAAQYRHKSGEEMRKTGEELTKLNLQNVKNKLDADQSNQKTRLEREAQKLLAQRMQLAEDELALKVKSQDRISQSDADAANERVVYDTISGDGRAYYMTLDDAKKFRETDAARVEMNSLMGEIVSLIDSGAYTSAPFSKKRRDLASRLSMAMNKNRQASGQGALDNGTVEWWDNTLGSSGLINNVLNARDPEAVKGTAIQMMQEGNNKVRLMLNRSTSEVEMAKRLTPDGREVVVPRMTGRVFRYNPTPDGSVGVDAASRPVPEED
jgi:hypothetical protein